MSAAAYSPSTYDLSGVEISYLPNGTYLNGTIPNNDDTDQDGLKDGYEAHHYYTTSKLTDGQGNTIHHTNPLNPDTDGDSVTDGKEVNGYDLVWMETFPDGSVKDHKMRSIHTNPLDPTNNLRDTDHDGMPDYYEVHYTEFYPYIVNWANDRHRQNPHDFNASEYLGNQFNPFVKENIPPMILGMSVTTHKDVVYDSITSQPMIYTPKQKTAYFPAIFAISSMSQ